MRGRPLTVCLFDPTPHKSVPHQSDGVETTLPATTLKISLDKMRSRMESLVESKPIWVMVAFVLVRFEQSLRLHAR